jgi:hypothetical protein
VLRKQQIVLAVASIGEVRGQNMSSARDGAFRREDSVSRASKEADGCTLLAGREAKKEIPVEIQMTSRKRSA